MDITQKNYILYGAASIGNIVKDSLEKAGLKIIGYIDKRAYELPIYNNLPVWSLDTIPPKYINPDTVIYVSVKNVFEHEQIVKMLYHKGFQYIIYKPYSVLLGYGNKSEYIISEIYDNMFAGNYSKDWLLPPCQVEETRELHDFAIILEENEMITAYIPVEFIFTNNYKNSGMEKWGNICIPAFFTHIDFFRFLNNDKTATPNDYLQEYCIYTAKLQKTIKITNAWQNNVIENRTQIYEQMRDALDLDSEFFIRNAAEAEWNDQKNYFNLTSGKHRCTFQAAVGKKYLPLKMTKTDYEKFLNKPEAYNIIHTLNEADAEISIPHPYFYRGRQMRDRGESQFFMWFARYYGRKTYYQYGKVSFEKLRIIDWTSDFGNFARFCIRMGCKVYRMLASQMLEIQLNQLLYSTLEYNREVENTSGNIIVIEREQLMHINPSLLNSKNTWIIRNTELNEIEQFAKGNNLYIAEKISKSYQAGKILWTCLLERADDAT